MKDKPVPTSCKQWLYNVYTLTTFDNKIVTIPLDDIDEDFKYKPYIKKIMKQRWNISKKTLYSIKHIFTEKNVHFYMAFLRHRDDNPSIKNSMHVTIADEICWRDNLLMIPSSTQKPTERPYLLEYPDNIEMMGHLLHFQDREFGCTLEQVFNAITKFC